MWSVCLVFCDCGFHSVCPLMDKGKRLMEASWWERLTVGETGSCSVGWGHAQSIFNQIFCWWVGLCSLSVVHLRPNYGRGNEDNGDLLQKVPCMHSSTEYPQPCSRPLLIHTSAGDSWKSTGKSGSVSFGVTTLFSFGVTAPFSWVLVCTRFVWALQVSLVGMGFDSKQDFAPPTVLLELLLCPWMWGIFFWWDSTFSC